MNVFIAQNNVNLLKQLIYIDTKLWNLQFSQNSKLINNALNFYKSLIILKSIPIVQEVYKIVLFNCELSYNSILNEITRQTDNTDRSRSITDFKFKLIDLNDLNIDDKLLKKLNNQLNLKQMETCFIFNLCILAELGSIKNNLILVSILMKVLKKVTGD